MATILSFAKAAGKAPSGSKKKRASGAAIIIFPGVRYERRHDCDPDGTDGSQPDGVRKRSGKI
ncbi:hypothetical protein AB2N04_15570 [Nitratireductor sp. GISD-1A_MAKvit]|uniref:hypothetical protein n=1 Tax=Nitratireductor sp. GISD-1A_MAKvit TaxID=3234198 RepID=UPI003466D7C8